VRHTLLLWLFLGLLGVARAETQYVTDQFRITMRSGESTGHKIVRMLPSGTGVEVLSRNATTGYTKVRVGGEEGYVLTRQLMDEPSARTRVAALQQRLKQLQAAPDNLRIQLETLQAEARKLQQENAGLLQAKQQLEQELAAIRRTAADAVRINNERNDLRKTVAALTREREDLKQENRDLSNQSAQRWFLIGAGVIILGIVLGLILPHLRFQRRKSSWGSL
jgi:SH3 domain protein